MSSYSGDVEHYYRQKLDKMKADHLALLAQIRQEVENVKRAATRIPGAEVRGAVFHSLNELLALLEVGL